MNYTEYITALASTLVFESTSNTDFTTILPTWINIAESRIYRELDMLVANVRDGSAQTTTNDRNFNLPTAVGTFLVVDAINIITPAGTAPASGTRNRCTPVSLSTLDWTWGSSTGSGMPTEFAYFTQNTYLTSPTQSQIAFGPWPDNAYYVEVVGKIQPAAISAINPNTYLSDNLYDLFFAASMAAATGWQQNFGSAGTDNPQMASNWEKTYLTLRDSAATQEARKRFAGASWTSKLVEPAAVGQRG